MRDLRARTRYEDFKALVFDLRGRLKTTYEKSETEEQNVAFDTYNKVRHVIELKKPNDVERYMKGASTRVKENFRGLLATYAKVNRMPSLLSKKKSQILSVIIM